MIECEWGLDRCSIERCPDRTVLMVGKPLRLRKDPLEVPPHRHSALRCSVPVPTEVRPSARTQIFSRTAMIEI